MTRLVPTLAILGFVALTVMGWTNKLPWQWFGLRTADLLALTMLAIPILAVLLVLGLLVRWGWQTREGVRAVLWNQHAQYRAEQDRKVVPFRSRRRSG